MNRIILIIVLLSILCMPLAVPLAHAKNPFTSPQETKKDNTPFSRPALFSKVFTKIILWQHYLKTRMTNLVRQAENKGSVKPIVLLILMAFVYGLVHAAGPGHGKVIALSYAMTQKPSYIQGLLFSNSIAFFHGASGIIFVIFVKFIINTGVMGSLDNVTNITQIVSYSIISIIGTVLFFISLYKILKKKKDRVKSLNKQLNPVFAAAVIGCIPCPGVVIIMLFALSMDLLVLSVVLGVAISFGMAVTVSIVVLLAISGKSAIVAVDGKRGSKSFSLESFAELFAGVILMILGLLLLGANLQLVYTV